MDHSSVPGYDAVTLELIICKSYIEIFINAFKFHLTALRHISFRLNFLLLSLSGR
jgi:hypothetical protein